MTNRTNMSYCMFENTAHAIYQLIEEMQQAVENGNTKDFVDEMSHEERAAFNEMTKLCENLQTTLEEFHEERLVEESLEEKTS